MKHKTVASLLRCGKRLLTKKNGWAKNTWARTKNGRRTCVGEVNAARFCAIGAVRHCARTSKTPSGLVASAEAKLYTALKYAFPGKEWNSVPAFNDSKATKLEDVIKLYNTAIRRLTK